MAAVDFFLKLDSVEGESTDDKHKGWIDIQSFSWGISQTSSQGNGGGGGAGKVSVHDLSVTKHFDKASPILLRACASGEHFKKAVLSARMASGDGKPQDFYIVTFEDCLVSSYQSSGVGGEVPGDEVGIHFQKVDYPQTNR